MRLNQPRLIDTVIVLGLAISSLLYFLIPNQAPQTLMIGSAQSEKYVLNMWLPEADDSSSFRWMQADSAILLSDYSQSAALAVSLRLAAPLLERGAGSPVSFRSDGLLEGSFPLTTSWRNYHILVKPDGLLWNTQFLSLYAPTVRAGLDDGRQLSARLSTVMIRPTQNQLLLPRMWASMLIFSVAALMFVWGRILFPLHRKTIAIMGFVAVSCGLAVAWRFPASFNQIMQPSWYIVMVVSSAFVIAAVAAGKSRLARHSLIAILMIMFVLIAGASLRWRIGSDLSIMHYIGVQIVDRGLVPYRDVFEQNAPGTYLSHAVIARLFGWSDPGLRYADLLLLSVLMGCSAIYLRSIDKDTAFAGALLAGLLYLNYGTVMTLQREYVIIVLVSIALALVVQQRVPPWLRALFIGMCFGFATTIKPHAILGWPFLIIALGASTSARSKNEPQSHVVTHNRSRRSFREAERGGASNNYQPELPGSLSAIGYWLLAIVRLGLISLLGLMLPVLGILWYLAANSALAEFSAIVLNYWPLYSQLNIVHQIVPDSERPAYLISTFFSKLLEQAPYLGMLLGAGLVSYRAILGSTQRVWVYLLWSLAAIYTLYPLLAGKFWFYHWLPVLYIYCLLGGLCVIELGLRQTALSNLPFDSSGSRQSAIFPDRSRVLQHMPLGLLLLSLIWRPPAPAEFRDSIAGQRSTTARQERVDRIADYLRQHLDAQDTVQALDWTGGAMQAMLQVNAPNATRFVEDFYFYHHIDEPYIQSLRKRFIQEFDRAQPRFVIEIYGDDKPWPTGPRTTRSFPELQQRLTQSYHVVLQGDGYRLYSR